MHIPKVELQIQQSSKRHYKCRLAKRRTETGQRAKRKGRILECLRQCIGINKVSVRSVR